MPNFYHGSAVWLKGPKAKCQRGHVITWLYKIYIRQVKFTLNLFFKDHMMLVKKLALRLLLYTVNALLQDGQIHTGIILAVWPNVIQYHMIQLWFNYWFDYDSYHDAYYHIIVVVGWFRLAVLIATILASRPLPWVATSAVFHQSEKPRPRTKQKTTKHVNYFKGISSFSYTVLRSSVSWKMCFFP